MFDIGSKRWNGLSKLIEECGEVVQVGGKILGIRGKINHFDGSNLKDRLGEEISDVLAATIFVVDKNKLNRNGIMKRVEEKLQKFNEWNEQ